MLRNKKQHKCFRVEYCYFISFLFPLSITLSSLSELRLYYTFLPGFFDYFNLTSLMKKIIPECPLMATEGWRIQLLKIRRQRDIRQYVVSVESYFKSSGMLRAVFTYLVFSFIWY